MLVKHKPFFWENGLPRGITLCRCLRQQFSCCLNSKVLLKQWSRKKRPSCPFLKWLNLLRFFHVYIFRHSCGNNMKTCNFWPILTGDIRSDHLTSTLAFTCATGSPEAAAAAASAAARAALAAVGRSAFSWNSRNDRENCSTKNS